jgi:hypothetical protein
MAADIQGHDHHQQDTAVHQRDYAGFTTLLKYSVIVIAIIAAAVIYIISN